MLLPHHQNAGQNYEIKIYFKQILWKFAKFKCSQIVVRKQNMIHKDIKRRLHSGNACYHSVQNLLSSHLMSKNIKIKIYKTKILPVFLYGCETWAQILREKCTLWRMAGPKQYDMTGGWIKLYNEVLHNLYSVKIIMRIIKSSWMRQPLHVAWIWNKRTA
jgi:hypothetical protein